MISPAEIEAIPKAELHCHLEGALHLETLWEFSQRHEPQRYNLFDDFKAACTVPKGTTPGFKPFLAKFNALRFHYGTLEDVERLIRQSVADFENWSCCYREFRFSPVFFARRTLKGDAANNPKLPFSLIEETTEAIIRGAAWAAHVYCYHDEYILTCARDFGYEVNKPTLDLLNRPIAQKIGGLDLAGDESIDASEFVKPFREWKEAGKLITIHAGEDPNAGGPGKIIEALDVFKADRIGHGVRGIEDPALVERLARERIPLEICPTSNVQTGAVSSEAAHPIKKLLDAGVRVTINTDDPVICGTTLDDEYAFASRLGLTSEDLRQCTRNAVEAGILADDEKRKLMLQISADERS